MGTKSNMFSDIELDYLPIPGGTPVIPTDTHKLYRSHRYISRPKWFVFLGCFGMESGMVLE